MDEQSTKKIVIKINGKTREIEEEKQVENDQDKLKVSSWEEKLKAEKELAASHEKMDREEEFPWVLPDDPKVVIPMKKDKKKITKVKQNPSTTVIGLYKKIIFIVSLAIVIGISFGMFAIHLLSKDTSSVPAQVVLQDETNIVDEKNSNETTNSNSQAPSYSLNLYVIQTGKFTNKNGADLTVSNIRERGFPAEIFEAKGSYYVFIGVTHNQSDAKRLRDIFEEEQIETYDKPINFKLSSKTPEDTKKIVEDLVEISSMSIMTSGSINKQNLNNLKKQNLENIHSSLQSAIELLGNSSLTKEQIWDVQQSILQFLSSEGKIE